MSSSTSSVKEAKHEHPVHAPDAARWAEFLASDHGTPGHHDDLSKKDELNLNPEKEDVSVDPKKCFAEFIAMMFFVYTSCGAATANAGTPGWVLAVSLQFGVAIMVLAYATAHISGGQINCAVTLALCITGDLHWAQGGANFIAQMLGSVTGAALLAITANGATDRTTNHGLGLAGGPETGGLGCNGVSDPYTDGGAFVAEFMMTALLVYVVLQTAVNKDSLGQPNLAPIPIGFAVFLAHVYLIPIDGCSINPTRSFGPAVVASAMGSTNVWDDMWLFWLAPLLGAATTAVITILAKTQYPNKAPPAWCERCTTAAITILGKTQYPNKA